MKISRPLSVYLDDDPRVRRGSLGRIIRPNLHFIQCWKGYRKIPVLTVWVKSLSIAEVSGRIKVVS